MLAATGQIVWVGRSPLGSKDGRITLYLREHIRELLVADEDQGVMPPNEVYNINGKLDAFMSRRGTPPIPDRLLRLIAVLIPDGETTYTCVPSGSGTRIGIDRYKNGILDNNDRRTRRYKRT